MVVFPPCKINLGLNIVAKRSDGFHDIETCFFPLPWTDMLEILPARELRMETSGIPVPGSPDENICLKAYRLLKGDFNFPPVHIYLHKIVPIGAGLGGGSADAAFTLLALNTIFDLKLTADQLTKYASKLGSDCAFFIDGVPAIGTGKGEHLTPVEVDLRGKHLVVIKPDLHVSTVEAYAGVVPGATKTSIKKIMETVPVGEWRYHLENDFEVSVFVKYPEIKSIKDSLYKAGAVYASMSGSGSSVFGIFDTEVNPKEIYSGTLTSWAGWIR